MKKYAKRERRIHFVTTAEEAARFEDAAFNTEQTLSEWIRAACRAALAGTKRK